MEAQDLYKVLAEESPAKPAAQLNVELELAAMDVRQLDANDQRDWLAQWNSIFASIPAQARVDLALKHFPGTHMLSSSFGAQAAVSLHMLSAAKADIPVVLLDTGYLFPETYQFVGELTERMNLNLHTYRSLLTPAEQESRFGQRWLQGVEGIDAYNHENKVEPMQRALAELEVGTWFTGIRRSQSSTRVDTEFVSLKDGRVKVAPIADWNDRDVFNYLKRYELPYHPLWHEGYVSIGDVHTTRSLHEVENAEDVRFFGLKRECGLHS